MIRFGPVELPDPAIMRRDGDTIEVELRGLSTAHKDALAAFFKNDARGMRETWVYVDAHGVEQRVRFDEAALVFVQFAANQWDVSTRLARRDGGR